LGLFSLSLRYHVHAQTAAPEFTPADDAPTAAPESTPENTAQTPPPIPRVHTVREGETLTSIAAIYGVTVKEILAANSLDNADLLSLGEELLIPGGSGEAVGTLYTAEAGDTLAGIAAIFNTTVEALVEANRLIHPRLPLVLGQPISVVSRTGSSSPTALRGVPHVVAPGETPLVIAARYGLAPQQLAAINDLAYPTYLFTGQRLRVPGEAIYRDLPEGWTDFRLTPSAVSQGSTLSIYVENVLEGEPNGRIGNTPLRFVSRANGYMALVGFDAFAEPGIQTLEITGLSEGERPWRLLQQAIQINDAGFGTQLVTVGPELEPLLAPEVRASEDAFLQTLFSESADEQRWAGLFQLPITTTHVSAGYGDGRSYNDGPVEIFHTGIDYPATAGTPALAPADGVVVFADLLELRGMVVIVDHGLGVMTAYFHLSEILVAEGDEVTAGQPLGAVGSTGLSSGPHLHWDLRVHGVPVNPLQWTTQEFP
jgi:murein DD-endopeptidase MepM/ murein hydrolase activator NlpD